MSSQKYLNNFCPALYRHMPEKGAPPGCHTQNRWSLFFWVWSHQCPSPLPINSLPAHLLHSFPLQSHLQHLRVLTTQVIIKAERAGLRWRGRGRFRSRRILVERFAKGVGDPASPSIRVAGSNSQWLRAGEARGRVWSLLTVCVTLAGCLFSGPQFPASQGAA